MLTSHLFVLSHLVVISHRKIFYNYLLVYRLKIKITMSINIVHKSKCENKTCKLRSSNRKEVLPLTEYLP